MNLELLKTKNTTFPLVERTNREIIELWHKSVGEFCQELGINDTNTHQVRLLKRDIVADMNTETSIEFNGKIVGVVTTALKQTAAGLKFTITCQKVSTEP